MYTLFMFMFDQCDILKKTDLREGGRGGFTIFEIAYLWEKYVSDLKNDRTRGNLKYHIVG